jgi:hypothetical protein
VRRKSDRAAIDDAFVQRTGNLAAQDRDDLAERAAKMAVLVKPPERIRAVVQPLVTHVQTTGEPNGFKAQVGVFDRACGVLDTRVMDELIGADASAIVERIVADLDDIVTNVRCPDGQHIAQGERRGQRERRRTLLKDTLHTDQDRFDRAYGDIRQYD